MEIETLQLTLCDTGATLHCFFEGQSPLVTRLICWLETSWKAKLREAMLTTGFPGYYIWHHDDLASLQSIFGQAWKEYSLSDSRYLTSDPFMLCIEFITVVRY